MTVDQDAISSFNDSQKTVYILERKPDNTVIEHDEKIPMVRLLDGKEEATFAELRLIMFQRFWSSKEEKIGRILANKNNDLFQEVSNYLSEPNESKTFKSILLMMGANLSNHTLILKNMVMFLSHFEYFTVVRLNSKDCNTIRHTLTVLISSIIDVNDKAQADEFENYLPYDFDAVVNWFQNYQSRRIIVIFEDSELFNVTILKQLLSIINDSTVRDKFKLVFGLSSSLNFFEANLPSSVIDILDGQIVNLSDSNETLREITDNILFDLEIENNMDFLLLLGPSLLRQLSKYEDNELLFIDVLKYCYSIYFFSNPLSILNWVSIDDNDDFEIDSSLIDLLRRTASFKKRIEYLKMIEKREEMVSLFTDDEKLAADFKKHYKNFYAFGVRFYKLLDLFILLQKHFNGGIIIQSKYQLYSEIIQQGPDFYYSQFYQELFSLISRTKQIQSFDEFLKEINDQTFLTHDQINDEMGSQLVEEITQSKLTSICRKLGSLIDKEIRSFFKDSEEISYKEVFTIEVQPSNGEDIITSSFNPFIRSSVETALTNPNSYLFKSQGNSPQDELSKLVEPIVCELFTLYREANIYINTHDFFVSFKESLQREKLVPILLEILKDTRDSDLKIVSKELSELGSVKLTKAQEARWEKMVLSWFLQAMSEMELLGFIKEAKKKSDSMEKLVWKGI